MATLAQIEQATARRVGPYYQAFADRQVPSTANFEYVLVPSLRSSVEQDLVTNLWLLRRGLDVDGNLVTVDPYDRQRLVANYEPERGQVLVDRPWSVIPAPGEVIEFHHLNPELELREAVRAGLRRVLFEDRFNLGQGYIYEADLTSALPWLDDLNMVKRVQVGSADVPFTVFGECGHVWVRVSGYAGSSYYGGLLVTVHRPHFSWVNGEDAEDGPTLDADMLHVDLDYAAAAAHIEAWHNFPAKLQAAAVGGQQATQKMAAEEFTRQMYAHKLPRHDNFGFAESFGWGSRGSVVINA